MMKVDSAKVQALMLKRGVGVLELAKLAKIPAKTISALHRRDAKVYISTLSRLAKALQIEPMSLVKAVA